MTVSFTLGKRFFKTAHYLLKIWIIIVMLSVQPVSLVLGHLFAGSILQLFEQDINAFLIGFSLIFLLLIAVGLRYFRYTPQNNYSDNSSSPKEDERFWQVLPFQMIRIYGISFVFFILYLLGEPPEKSNWEHWSYFYSSEMHLLISVIALYRVRREYDLCFDSIWPNNGSDVTLIIKHRSLLDGKTPDGLAHLKEGDLVKLVPSDVPAKENSTINVVNERTPNGPVLIDRIFSKSMVRALESTHVGYMYGEISRFKVANYIELTLSKHHIPLPSDYCDFAELDELFEKAALLVVQTQQGSTSMIQRKFELGYNRAGRIVDQLEAKGILGPFEGSKAREVLIASEEELKERLDEIDKEYIFGRSE